VTDLFGVAGRELLDRLEVPQPWRGTIDASLELIDDLQRQIAQINTTKAALCAASTMLTAHPAGGHAI
jgi:hypothetical protein